MTAARCPIRPRRGQGGPRGTHSLSQNAGDARQTRPCCCDACSPNAANRDQRREVSWVVDVRLPINRDGRVLDTGKTMPKIVITMPAFHAETTLERTVEAIPRGVADELILVDDASTDATAEVAHGLGLDVHVH